MVPARDRGHPASGRVTGPGSIVGARGIPDEPYRALTPAGAYDGYPVRFYGTDGLRTVEVFGIYHPCPVCEAPAAEPLPRDWTVKTAEQDDDLTAFGEQARAVSRPLWITPHRADCPTVMPPEVLMAVSPRPVPAELLPDAPEPPAAVMIAPAGAAPADRAAFVDVGHTTGDGLRYAEPASDHNPGGPAVDVGVGDLFAAFQRASATVAVQFRELGAALSRILEPLRRSPLLRLVVEHQRRIDRGTKRAVRRGTATTRAIIRRDGRRVPKRGPRLHRIRAAYRHRQ